jgi:hypothetical protein
MLRYTNGQKTPRQSHQLIAASIFLFVDKMRVYEVELAVF